MLEQIKDSYCKLAMDITVLFINIERTLTGILTTQCKNFAIHALDKEDH